MAELVGGQRRDSGGRRERGPGRHLVLRTSHRAPGPRRRTRSASDDALSARRRIRFVVAHDAAGAVPSAQYAVDPQRRLRSRAAPSPGRVAKLDHAAARAGDLLPPRRFVDVRRQARTGSSDVARVRRTWMGRRRDQLPPRTARPVARTDRGRDTGARLDQEEHRHLRGRSGPCGHQRRVGRWASRGAHGTHHRRSDVASERHRGRSRLVGARRHPFLRCARDDR